MRLTRVLIVDDSLEEQQALISLIEEAGAKYVFDTALTGCDAATDFEDQRHDCVIVDYRLQKEDGLEIMARLKTIDPFCAVIMMSGQGSEEIATKAMKSGAVDYLVKGNVTGFAIRSAIQRAIQCSKAERKASVRQQEQSQFLTTLVHDIRAPLSNIRNSTAMLVENIERGTFDDIDKLVAIQAAAVKHADALIRTLQTYALLDENVEFERINLNYVLELLTSMFRGGAQNPDVRFEITPLPDVTGHAPQISQLFQNLISNALKYNESPEKQVKVRLSAETKDALTICVEDNGLGMDTRSLKEIFLPLKRLWSKDEYEGTGLGLSICKKIVARHQGKIWCESRPGVGSKFFVELNRAN